MRKITVRLLIAAATFVFGLAVSGIWLGRPSPHIVPSPSEPPPLPAVTADDDDDENAEQLRVTCDPPPFTQVRAQVVPASPLTDPTHKPDYVAPEHVRLTFGGRHRSEPQATFFPAEVSVYPVAAYKQAYFVSNRYTRIIIEELEELRKVIDERQSRPPGEMPYVPYVDASQAFAARIRHINLQGGKGVVFLTQYSIEPSLVSNQGLTYIFQGLTDDGRYYVLATFPVSAPGLPDESSLGSHEGFTLGPTLTNTGEWRQEYQAYTSRVARKLGVMSPARFTPTLTQLDRVIGSLRVGRAT